MSVDANIAYALANETGANIELAKMALERTKTITEAKQRLEQWLSIKAKSSSSDNGASRVYSYFDKQTEGATVVKMHCTNEHHVVSHEFRTLMGNIIEDILDLGKISPENHSIICDQEKRHDCRITYEYTHFVKQTNLCLLTTYNHRENQISVIVETEVDKPEAFNNKLFRIFSFDCAMHIAAFNPLVINKSDISKDVKDEFIEAIHRESARDGKPIAMWNTIANGKFEKWSERRSLMNQIFIKEDTMTVENKREALSKQIGATIEINRFARYEV